jgi:osmotically-inducible protein OsmY
MSYSIHQDLYLLKDDAPREHELTPHGDQCFTGEHDMKKPLAVISLLGALAALPASGAEPKGSVKDAWITGKIETVYLLNRHLSAFDINTEVTEGTAHLTGKVESDIDRDLAGELAKGVEGVVSVDNDLVVDAKARIPESASAERPFGVWVDDVTTTAAVKSKLLTNGNTEGLQIDVDTRNDTVTLSGEVTSPQEKQLAEQLARNTGDVKEVHNQLVVRNDN